MPESTLERIARGDAGAVRACIEEHGPRVTALARRMLGRAADVEDVVQEVFIEIWRHAGRFDPSKGSEAQFVAMVARRRLIDVLRRTSRRPETELLDEERPASGASTAEDAAVRDEVARAKRAMERLRPEQQRVLGLAIQRGLTHDEIARRTGMPLGTVKTHARRGLMRLRELLAERAPTPAPGGGTG